MVLEVVQHQLLGFFSEYLAANLAINSAILFPGFGFDWLIISVIFMPLTLIAGIYGMNFDGDGPWSMPELRWRYGYPFALGLMIACTIGLLLFFHHRGWIGDPLAKRRAKGTRC